MERNVKDCWTMIPKPLNIVTSIEGSAIRAVTYDTIGMK